MVNVGDHIRLSSMKGPDREGVVTAVTGPLVRVRWPSDQETTVIPAPGTLTVLADSPALRTPTKKPAKATTDEQRSGTSPSAAPKKPARERKATKRPSR